MRIIRNVYKDMFAQGSVLTIGNFDGVHLGHRALLEALKKAEQRYQCPSLLMTFEPQPLEFFQKQNSPVRITLFRDKVKLLSSHELSALIALRFQSTLAGMSAATFVEKVLFESLHIKALIVGDDFHFGKGREGSLVFLKRCAPQFGFEIIEVPSIKSTSLRISSTYIRDLLAVGDIKQAEALLGHSMFISGKVVHGDKRGRQLGYPTANIPLSRRKPPFQGIFVVSVSGLGAQPLPGVASLGFRPMFDGKLPILEVHLLDFNQDIYGKRLVVHFHKKLRDEINFDSIERLIEQMNSDKTEAYAYFESQK